MAKWRFTNSQTLIYPEFGVLAEPGSVHDWPDEPPADGHWEPTGQPAARRAPKPEPAVVDDASATKTDATEE